MIWLLVLIVIVVAIGGGWWGWPLMAGLFGVSSIRDKSDALPNITRLMRSYGITTEEIETALRTADATRPVPLQRTSGDIAKTLFIYLGAIFILAGISTYIGMFWSSMGSAMHIFMTLGVGYILLVVLLSALYENKYPKLVIPLALASVCMLTGGWFVLIHELFPRGDNWRIAVLSVFGIMAVHQGAVLRKYQLTVLAFTVIFFIYGFLQVGFDLLGVPIAYIAIILGISLFLVATGLENTSFRALSQPGLVIGIFWLNSGLFDRIAVSTSANWASLITGLCVMSAAYGLHKEGRHPRLSGFCDFTGSIMAYAGSFDLLHHSPAELLFLAITASMLYACVVLQSRALLFTTVIAMLGFIEYYTAHYFANSLGWPVTLVLMGIIFLGVGVLAMKLKRQVS